MKANEMMVYDGCPELEKIALVRAHIAAIQRERREREAAAKRRILEPGEIDLYQPQDFRD